MKRLATAAAFLGFIFFCLGTVLAVLFPLHPIGTWVWGVSVLFVLAWGVLERERLLRFVLHRTTRQGANLTLIVLLVCGIAAFINFFGHRYRWRADLTAGQVHTLSTQTQDLLAGLQRDVEILHFDGLTGDPTHDTVLQADKLLLENFVAESPRLRYRFLNPNLHPVLAKQMEVSQMRTVVVRYADDAEGNGIRAKNISEENVAAAIMRLTATTEPIVYFLTGHGERDLTSARSPESLSRWKAMLEREVYEVKTLNLTVAGGIPEDAAALVIAGPRKAFFPHEIDTLRTWLLGGGRMLVALDIDVKEGKLPVGAQQLAALLREFGISVGEKMLVDSSAASQNMQAQFVLAAADAKDHEITKDFARAKTSKHTVVNFFFPLTTKLQRVETPMTDLQFIPLAKASNYAWEESSWKELRSGQVQYNADQDLRGDLKLAFAVRKEAESGDMRLAVFGTAALGVNAIIEHVNNSDLLMNTIAWLTRREQRITVRDHEPRDTRLDLNQNWLTLVYLLVVLALPVSLFATGIWVWHGRRSR